MARRIADRGSRLLTSVLLGFLIALTTPARAQAPDKVSQRLLELIQKGDYAEAATEAERAAAETKASVGANHLDYARAISRHGQTLLLMKRLTEAEPLFKRTLEIQRGALPPDSPELADTFDSLGYLLNWAERNSEAEPLLKQAFAIREKTLNGEDPGFLETAYNLNQVYQALVRPEEAERILLRAIGVVENKLGANHVYVTPLLQYLSLQRTMREGFSGGQLNTQASGANKLEARVTAILDTAFAQNQTDGIVRLAGTPMKATLSAYGYKLLAENKLSQVERVGKIMASFRLRAVHGQRAYGLATDNGYMFLQGVYENSKRFSDYEAISKEHLDSLERFVKYHPDYVIVLTLAYDRYIEVEVKQKNYAQAEQAFKRVIALKEASADPVSAVETLLGGPLIGAVRYPEGLVSLYEKQRKFADGEATLMRALALREKHQGANHPETKELQQRLAQWRKKHGASPGTAAIAKAPAPSQPASGKTEVTTSNGSGCSNLLDLVDNWEARKVEARKHCSSLVWGSLDVTNLTLKSSAFNEQAPGNFASLAEGPFEQEDWSEAVALLTRSVELTATIARRNGSQPKRMLFTWTDSSFHQIVPASVLIKAAHRAAAKEPNREPQLLQTGFNAAQHAHMPTAAVAVAQMMARIASGGGKLGLLVRERQDLAAERTSLDQQAIEAAKQSQSRNQEADQRRLARSNAIGQRIGEIDRSLSAEFPDYTTFAYPQALSVSETQAQLRADEALILFADTPQMGHGLGAGKVQPAETYLWVITKTQARWFKTSLGGPALANEIAALRCGLDDSNWAANSDQRTACTVLLQRQAAEGALPPFDLVRAHGLYRALFGEATALIAGKRLLIVPTGPLTSLPFQVLVTQKPAVAVPTDPDGYRNVKWLGAQQAITVLPSTASLKALRAGAKSSSAPKPFIGFGNPLLDGYPADPGDRTLAALAQKKQSCPAMAIAATDPRQRVATGRAPTAATVFGGSTTDTGALRQAAAALPETTDELCAVNRSLGGDASDILLGARMTEAGVKELSASGRLRNYRVLHFATHGLVAGETEQFTQGKAEPALIFTPPATGSETDDGLLTASEVAQLSLDADWVVLSACNTAAGGAKEAEALSGLARAFFYAGARALLVSHWRVNSEAAVVITTGAFDAMKADPKIGRAEALLRSQRALMAKGGAYAHPAMWSPFVLVGEGGAN